ADVDFRVLAQRYERSGGDIKNAVLKAALAAADEPGPDHQKAIRQEHFERAMDEVVDARRISQQSLLDESSGPEATLARMEQRQTEQQQAIERAFQEIARPLRLAIGLAALAAATAVAALLLAILR
ncbi:MAG TPA: hypothetical protein VK864_11500, partial [Longimicrobiales bacterium]|nr:hypothetical protein [Longimicrobiales bacterium]